MCMWLSVFFFCGMFVRVSYAMFPYWCLSVLCLWVCMVSSLCICLSRWLFGCVVGNYQFGLWFGQDCVALFRCVLFCFILISDVLRVLVGWLVWLVICLCFLLCSYMCVGVCACVLASGLDLSNLRIVPKSFHVQPLDSRSPGTPAT